METQSNWIVVALAGVTNSGKTTLAKRLIEYNKNAIHIKQDDYFLPEDDSRHIRIDNLGHHNWEILTALDMDKMIHDVQQVIHRSTADTSPNLLLLDGFLVLNDLRLVSMCHLKFYLDITYEECRRRRFSRTYDPPDVPGYFEQVVWPESLASRKQAFDMNPDIIVLDGGLTCERLTNIIINNIEEIVKKNID